MSFIERLALPFLLATTVALAASSSSTDDALMTELAQADGRTLDANGNLIPAPLDRSSGPQKIGTRTVSVPTGMRLVPADAAAGTPEFLAGIYEVTQAEYSAFLAANPAIAAPRGWADRRCPRGAENHPVTGISQLDAQAYCAWVAKNTGRAVMLPTVAQAAAYSRGAALSPNAPPVPLHAVGANSRDVSAASCFDVRGNAAEWLHEQTDGKPDARTGFRLVAAVDSRAVSDGRVPVPDAGSVEQTPPPTPDPVPRNTTSYINITKQPTSQPVVLGGSFTLEVGATMVPANDGRTDIDRFDLSYQWIKDDAPIAGATSSSYAVQSLRETDAGIYWVTIANAATGIVTYSAPAVIDIGLNGATPRITRIPPDVAVASGGTAAVSFEFETSHRYALAWTITQTSLFTVMPAAPDIQVTASATSSTATWRNAARDGGLTFTFRVITAYGTAEASTKVTVINDGAAPTIVRHPSSVTATRGGNVTLEISATGTPAPTYQWLRNGIAIQGATASTLTLQNVQDADIGSYSVTATNVLGSTTSNVASVTLAAAPAPSSGGSGGGGGGSPSRWFAAAAAVALAVRSIRVASGRSKDATP